MAPLRALLASAVVLLAFAGCLGQPAAPLDVPSGATVAPAAVPPFTLSWDGVVLASEVDQFSHFRPTEDALWPVQQEGFLLQLPTAPQAMEVTLDWTGEGRMMIMLHSHKGHGTNAYVEHVTTMSADHPQCLRVPAEDLADGDWQVMVHSDGARQAPFKLTVNTWGVEGQIVENDRHGHWPQDGAFSVDEHKPMACGEAAS